jgi:proline iminopeptidase
MNVPQMEQDTLDVANHLRNRFKREKIFVLGLSWGSVSGLWLAHEHPELIYAYVGVAQAVNMEQYESLSASEDFPTYWAPRASWPELIIRAWG